MTIQTRSWEPRLITLAQEGLNNHAGRNSKNIESMQVDSLKLMQAFDYCSEMTRVHSKTFYLTSGLLPPLKRQAIRSFYAFCRITDDLIDRKDEFSLTNLQEWEECTQGSWGECESQIAYAWNYIKNTFEIPQRYVEQLVEGVRQDLWKKRYNTFDELAHYCYGVASTVGLISMYIIGFKNIDAIGYAVKLGVALQLTNILRDVGEDWSNGRLYLPLDELRFFNLGETDISDKIISDNWKRFMQFQINRTRQLYSESIPGIKLLNPDGRFAITAAAKLYQEILDDIERNDFDVFNRRAFVSSRRKLMRLPSIWWQSIKSV